MVFQTKKIQLETLSEYLTEVRTSLGLSLEEVAAKTNIKPKFLEFLENNEFAKLPADVYVFGFLRQLSILYAIEPQVLIEQYKKERQIAQQLQKKPLFKVSRSKKLAGRVVITPKRLSVTVGLLFVAVTLGYIIWQVSSINKTPSLAITEPQDRQVIKDSVVTVAGTTDPGISLSINNQNVFVDSQGNFKTQVSVDSGPEQLAFVAQNKFGKAVNKTITVIGDNASVPSAQTLKTTGVQLRLEFTDSVTLNFSVDDSAAQTLSFNSGDAKVLNGQNKIVISTSNAGATKVFYNNQDVGFLGKAGESLSNVPFFAQANPVTTSTASSTP